MKTLIRGVVLACAVLVSPTGASAQAVDPAFEKDIVRLLDLTGAQKLGEQMTASFTQQFGQALRQANPNVPPRMIEIAGDVAKTLFAKEYPSLVPHMVSAYAKVMTRDDVRQLIAFYESPLGRRVLELTPLIAQAGTEASQTWVQQITPQLQAELQRRFKEEGFVQ